MSDASLQESVSLESLVAGVADEFMERQRNGERPNVEAYAARHPEAADLLRKVLTALEVVGLSLPGSASLPDDELLGVLGDFHLLREVGRGGMGVVYEAEQISLRRRVALKVLPFAATMDPRHLQRFHNEAQAAACLHHTNIVPVFFVGCERGVHFYAMQFIDGQPLSDLIRQLRQAEKKAPASADEEPTIGYQSPLGDAASTPLPAAEITPWTSEGHRSRDYFRKVAELGVQAAEALDHAHQLGIVHRDIKPANLLLDGRGNLWVTDFGLAHMQQGEANLTVTGQLVGTPRYMSPEQALAQRVPIDHRTDVYSLGATLYELLTLRPAFDGDDRQELLQQIAFEEPARPRRLERAIPAELEIIVLKAMEKRPQDRYATAQELADDLRRWLLDQPIHARRPNPVQRLRKWGRRHKPAVTSGAVVLLMALGMAGYVGWMRYDRAVRRAAGEMVVLAALEDSRGWQQQRRLPEALSAARRANGLLAGVDVDDALRERVRVRLADLELLDRLENIRLEKGSAVKDDHFDEEEVDVLYGQTFREAGLDVEALSVEQAGERIRGSTVAVELAAVLDHWALIRRVIRGVDDPGGKNILRIARAADANVWRTRVWEAWERRDRRALREMVASDEVSRLSPTMLIFLGSTLLGDKEAPGQVEAFLRAAQRRHPNNFWLNLNLWNFFRAIQPPQVEEAIRFAAVMVALRPESPGAHTNLGNALKEKGQLDEAIAEHREAIRLKKDYAAAHNNLGNALKEKGQLDEAIAEYREAIRLKKDFAGAHTNLGDALKEKGQLDEAIAEHREAIRLKKDYAAAHNNLGNALKEKGQLDEAIAEHREAIQLKKDFAEFHYNLGLVLQAKGQLDDAIAEYKEAIRLNKDFAKAHYCLGVALQANGRLDEAIAEYKEAIRIKKDFAEANCNLGDALERMGLFAEALVYRRRGHELGSQNPRWPYPSAQWVRICERLVELDGKLPAILSRHKQPADTAERIAFAQLCQMPFKKHYADAVRFYRDAFDEAPKLADDLNAQHRYNAACAAARAGCGQGKDADKLDSKERARLRQQALDWLRADLKAYQKAMEKSAGKAGPAIAQRMQHWLKDEDFASVRGDESLPKLPEAEREEWQKLWQEVEALRQHAAEKPAAARPARPGNTVDREKKSNGGR